MIKEINKYNVKNIAKYIIDSCNKKGKPVNNYQLQRILYILQSKRVVEYNETLFDEDVIAHQFGPVIHSVYHEYVEFGLLDLTFEYEVDIDKDIEEFIDLTIEDNSMREPWGTSQDILSTGELWLEIYNNGEGEHEVIPIEEFYETFKKKRA